MKKIGRKDRRVLIRKMLTLLQLETLLGLLGALLLNKGATVTTCHSKTTDLKVHTKNADILVIAVGKPHLVTEDMVKEGAIVIDVGINRVDGKLMGDVDTENVAKKAGYITPVPGGVGLTTVYTLMENVVELADKGE